MFQPQSNHACTNKMLRGGREEGERHLGCERRKEEDTRWKM